MLSGPHSPRRPRIRSSLLERKNSRKNKASFPSDSEPEENNFEGEGGEIEEGPPPLTESEWSKTEDDDTETSENEEVDSCGENSENKEEECNSCTFKVETTASHLWRRNY